jgi:hypothetical protein
MVPTLQASNWQTPESRDIFHCQPVRQKNLEAYATLNISAATTITKLPVSAFIARPRGFCRGNVNDVTM